MSGPDASEALALLDTLFTTAPVGLGFLDRDLRYVRVNECLATINGLSVAAHLGRTVGEVVPDLAPTLTPLLRRVLESGEAWRDLEVSAGTGAASADRGHRLASYYPVRTPDGRTVGIGVVVLDVTERRRAMDQLAAQRAFLRQVIDLNPSFIFAKDRAGRFTLVNQAVAEAYGTTVEDLIGRTDADFNPNPEEVAHFRRDDLEVMDKKREKFIPEEVITDAAGHVRHLQTIKRPIVGEGGVANQVLGVATDITARKALEEQLAQAQKMEAIGRLAGGVAHDFNNLLTVILGSIDIMLEGLGPDHPLRANAEEVRKAAERTAMLTRQLLVFGRKQDLQPRVIDLNRVVTESARMLRHLIGEDVELVTAPDAARANVKADPAQVTQVILNLAINARDAMPGGGTLAIRTADATLDAAYAASHPGVVPGEYVRIAVSDTGHGIAPDVLPHVFEPFFTTKALGHGTGLGLATSYGIVRQSGGHITVASAPGRGATFHVYLPRVLEAAEPPDDPAAHASGGQETILLVEDEEMVRGVASRSLRMKGYQVLEAANGTDALAVAAAHAGPIHLLVTDVVMPQMGGMELAARLSRTRPETRVLYTSGYFEESSGLPVEPGAAGAFLPKPYLPETLMRRIREVLDARER